MSDILNLRESILQIPNGSTTGVSAWLFPNQCTMWTGMPCCSANLQILFRVVGEEVSGLEIGGV